MRYVLIGLSTFFLVLACDDAASQDSQGTDDMSVSTDAEALWPDAWSILSTSCGAAGACHNRSSDAPDGINLPSDDEATTKTNAIAHKSKIRNEVSSGGMPKDSTLSAVDRAKITDWIDAL